MIMIVPKNQNVVFGNQLANLKDRIVKNKPIMVPPFPIPKVASGGIMALTSARDNILYGRGVPENTIFRARLNYDNVSDGLVLTNVELVLSAEMYPATFNGKKVIGYEDPTFVDKKCNPFAIDEEGFMCSQVYQNDKKEGVYTNLVYVGLDGNGEPKCPLTILTPEMIMDFGVAFNVDMVKEGELFSRDDDRKTYMLFEYAGSHEGEPNSSNIGLAVIENGQVTKCQRFWTAIEDGSEHISTDSSLLQLSETTYLLFFNRCRGKEWGINCMTVNMKDLKPEEISPDWIVQAPSNEGLGPGDQLIAFVSSVAIQSDGNIEIFYHVNDNRPYYALLKL